ncbi:sensor histidine kinase [Caldisalinibacter kiritimatiensis]|uniref:histidine kinase n=1 Tax=Caldisalinibacter kiritimatiensis TaxID=1304284 RepID=R1AUD9_9FIRM|nr:HAMP domain-containing sensor histidine kinase [Caldisalinibacter kiritimatiensis]EOD00272.1 Histidine kinase [Caldisalinibacter kiritimatiensis]
MKKSISIKLFVGMIIFTLITVGLVWILNTQFLDDFYLNRKKKSLIEYGNNIKSLYEGDIDSISLELERIENLTSGNITIVTGEGEIKYATILGHRSQGMGKGNGMWSFYIETFNDNEKLQALINGEAILNIYNHPRFSTKILLLSVLLKNNEILFIESPIQSIEEGVEITKDFYVYIGFISLVVAIIIAYIFSKIITKPIIKLNNVAKKMATLDFSYKYQGKTDDEIGELGQTINYLSNKLDITIRDLNKANEQLKKDIERERALEKMRKQFVSSVSHELKTPISLIQGYAEGLKDSVANDEESRKFYCDVIIDESEKMGKLVKDLLDLSQLESGSFKLEIVKFDIKELIEEVVSKYNPIFSQKNIKLKLDIDDDIQLVYGDKIRIEQVLVNFITNAINHIKGDNVVKITVKKEQNKVKVNIFNSGEHIPESEIEKIWDRFYKVDKARTRKYGGTGLGLSIVKRILKLHDSKFGVDNVDRGVEFWFYLNQYNS